MNRTGFAIAVGALFCLSAAAQSQTGAQAGAQSTSQAAVQAGQTQAQASAMHRRQPRVRRTGRRTVHWLLARRSCALSRQSIRKVQAGDPVSAHSTEAVKSEGKTWYQGFETCRACDAASARANGESESSLGIVFDKAILKMARRFR